MAANNMRQLIGQLEAGYYGGTKVTISKEGRDAITAEFNAEQERKRRGLMSDAYNLDCSRNPPSRPFQDEQDALLRDELNRQLAKAGLPQAPVYERKPDNGNRNRRTDKPVVSDPVNQRAHSHYFKDVSKLAEIDIYAVCQLFGVNDPSGATQHAVKKLLMSGQRGVKDAKRDLQEAADTLARKLQMMEGAA